MTWTEARGALTREIRTPDFMSAFRLVSALVAPAEALGHHPDLAFGWGYVRITLTTHDAGGITALDRQLARLIDEEIRAMGLDALEQAAPLWCPSAAFPSASALEAFRERVQAEVGLPLADSRALHAWSIADPGAFWKALWGFAELRGDPGPVALQDGPSMMEAAFFPQGRLSFAENLLEGPADLGLPAIIARNEAGARRVLSWRDLQREVAAVAAALRRSGVQPGDRVAAWMPNLPETVVVFLAAAAVGAVFSSTSSDFGVAGVLERFGQIEPTVLLAADGYRYGGREFHCLERLQDIRAGLPSLRATVVVGHLQATPDLSRLPGAVAYADWATPEAPAPFPRFPFNHPLAILYSSGTTGAPKGIVHRAGGLLLKHASEHRLHCGIREGDRVFYYTTCGWMMWNWLVSALAAKATLLLYDGHPFHPSPTALFDLAQEERATFLGVSAKFIDGARKAGLQPAATHDLGALRTVCSTGSPLSPEGFQFIYRSVKADVHLASISGGTDLCGCFVLGDPTRPVVAGEIQGPALGMAVAVFSPEGRPLGPGESGELVCTGPFPSMPLGFWKDPDGARYRQAYFERFPGVWAHGDFAHWTARGGMVIEGRCDATLNAGGVRIGTAELYRQVESFPEVAESLAVGQAWEGDTRIVLFLRMAEGHALDDALRDRLRQRLREACTPRHVPARILEARDFPRTRSGKLSELAVADVVNGRPVRNTEALANPDSLEAFRGLAALAE